MGSKALLYLLIVIGFLGFSVYLYTYPIQATTENIAAQNGKILWQKNNCSACHQLYGLGGYLGPDLTNYTARKGSSVAAFNGILQGGNKQMPKYRLSKEATLELYAFLIALNETGNANPNKAKKTKWGMISNE